MSSFSNAAAPQLLRAVIDGSSSAAAWGSGGNNALTAGEKATLVRALGIFTVGALGSWLRTKSLGVVSARVGQRLRRALLEALLRQEASFFDHAADEGGVSVADVDARLGRDVDSATGAITANVGNVLRYTSSVVCGSVMVARVGSAAATLRFACLGAGLVLVAVPATLVRKVSEGGRAGRTFSDFGTCAPGRALAGGSIETLPVFFECFGKSRSSSPPPPLVRARLSS